MSGHAHDPGSAILTPEEMKRRFLDSAEDLDREFGLDRPHGAWEAVYHLVSTGVTVFRSRFWLLPLIGGILGVGGKAAALLSGLFKPRGKKAPRRKNGKS